MVSPDQFLDKRAIPGFDGYFASAAGEVFSMKRGTLRRLSPSLRGPGYLYFCPIVDGKMICIAVHRAVALAFLANPGGHPQVNHIDGDKLNNCASNLEWVSQRRNLDHGVEAGLFSNCRARPALKREFVLEAVAAYKARTSARWGAADLAKKFGVTAPTVTRAVAREIKNSAF